MADSLPFDKQLGTPWDAMDLALTLSRSGRVPVRFSKPVDYLGLLPAEQGYQGWYEKWDKFLETGARGILRAVEGWRNYERRVREMIAILELKDSTTPRISPQLNRKAGKRGKEEEQELPTTNIIQYNDQSTATMSNLAYPSPSVSTTHRYNLRSHTTPAKNTKVSFVPQDTFTTLKKKVLGFHTAHGAMTRGSKATKSASSAQNDCICATSYPFDNPSASMNIVDLHSKIWVAVEMLYNYVYQAAVIEDQLLSAKTTLSCHKTTKQRRDLSLAYNQSTLEQQLREVQIKAEQCLKDLNAVAGVANKSIGRDSVAMRIAMVQHPWRHEFDHYVYYWNEWIKDYGLFVFWMYLCPKVVI